MWGSKKYQQKKKKNQKSNNNNKKKHSNTPKPEALLLDYLSRADSRRTEDLQWETESSFPTHPPAGSSRDITLLWHAGPSGEAVPEAWYRSFHIHPTACKILQRVRTRVSWTGICSSTPDRSHPRRSWHTALGLSAKAPEEINLWAFSRAFCISIGNLDGPSTMSAVSPVFMASLNHKELEESLS